MKRSRLTTRYGITMTVLVALAAQPSQGQSAETAASQLPELPWIVRIDTVGGAAPVKDEQSRGSAFRPADGPTTGVVWSPDGLIVTSSFNFAREPLVILVTLASGEQLVAKLVAKDRVTQLALLRVNGRDLPTPRPISRDAVLLGAPVWAAGFGYATQEPAVNHGVVSALYRIDGLALQTDANTSPANYGGPLIDEDGRLVGVIVPLAPRANTLDTEQRFSGVDFYDSGIGFAIPAEIVADRVAWMESGTDLDAGKIGAGLDPRSPIVGNPQFAFESPPVAGGVRIMTVGSAPANEHDICPGDVIAAIDDLRIANIRELRRALAPRVAGEMLRLSLLRDSEQHDVTLRLASARELEAPKTDEETQPLLDGLKKLGEIPLPDIEPQPAPNE